MKPLLSVCWGEERLRAQDMILWMLRCIILCLALNSANFKTPQYPHNMRCSDRRWMVFTFICKTGEKSWKSTWRSLLGAGAHTRFLSCRRHRLPFYHDSSMMWNSVIKGISPFLGRGGQELGVGEGIWQELSLPVAGPFSEGESLLANQDLIVQGM